jgi:glycosyltransferase involved in cell wall biosynthesis
VEHILENKIKDKKIVFFTAETFPSPAGGGRNAFSFARYLARKGSIVTIGCLNYNNKIPRREQIDEVSISRYRYYNKSLFSKLLSVPFLILNYYKTIKKADIIFIYGYYLPANYLILLFGISLKKKIVFRSSLLGEDDIISIRKKSGKYWFVIKPLIARINLYFAINSKFAELWQQVFQNEVPVLTSFQGVDSSIFNPANRKFRNTVDSSKEITLLSCGIICERKGYRQIFETLAKINFTFKYIVVGQFLSNPYHKSSLKEIEEARQICEYGKRLLGEKMEFINSCENMAELYRKADVFLHGAVTEGTPNVLLEAMAVSMPVIIKKLEGLSDIIISGNNADVYINDEELGERLQYLFDNPDYCKAIGTNAAAAIEKDFTFSQIADKIIEKLYGV